ncbi:Carnitine O-palmitoyltransferase 2, mitochondrial-like Protein [Tribolium castaneum]|uniref:Carnitine O-palmitoyltransferase 2, mitochondrial-like Protein n=1 Tax=Tribolium castaneum TaxID=7070 RepID=D6W820_TRICA|nr:Carnitine O-palmitoyltransferase 2, mitochondrial-like Protein [Tribolium castaneum]
MVFPKTTPLQNQSRAILKLLDKNLVNREYVEYQFIQQSQIPTSHFQSALPRLPIPELKLTCERYLAAQRPLLIDESYKKTEANVYRFRDGVGKQLQKILKDYDNKNKHTSYISELWFDKYLRSRSPLPLNCNPVLVLNNDDKPEYNNQLIRATNLIVSSLRFYRALKSELLHPEIFHLNPKKSDTERLNFVLSKLPPKLAYICAYFNKAFPLDMSQYPSLFQTTRIPETDKDRLVSCPESKHITVQYKGRFYSFEVLTVSNDIVSPTQIMDNIKFILSDKTDSDKFPIGVLTTLERNKWATIRHELAENGNEALLKTIDSALFHVCLDEETVGSDPYKITKQFLHADGANRWFDNSFSLIVARDGAAAVNFEHAWGDGVAVLRYAQDIYNDAKNKPRVHPDTALTEDSSCQVQRLEVHLNDHLRKCVDDAKNSYKTICDNLDVNYTIFEGIGKDTCKKSQVSPDAIMQLAFQLCCEKQSPIDDLNSSIRRSSFGWSIVSAIIMDAYEVELYGDYPNLNNNELPYIIGCLHTKNMEAVQKFFLRGLYKDVKIHQITRWKRNCQPVCVYTVVYKIKVRTPDLSEEEIFIPFPDNEEDLKKMFRHITEMVFGMRVVEKKLSDDGVFASISYAPVRCACNVRNFDMAAEEPRMQPLITEVAYHKINGLFVSTYESCSTSAFKHGRTEAIRPCTTATKDVTLAINALNKPPVAQLKKMIQECSTIHNRLIKEAAMGQGFDRHLFALKSMGEKNDIKSNIFDDPEYSHMGYDILSTSTLNSPAIFAGGFGPVVPEGFGLGYVIKDEFLGTLATNYKDRTNGPDFMGALTKSFEEIFAILRTN